MGGGGQGGAGGDGGRIDIIYTDSNLATGTIETLPGTAGSNGSNGVQLTPECLLTYPPYPKYYKYVGAVSSYEGGNGSDGVVFGPTEIFSLGEIDPLTPLNGSSGPNPILIPLDFALVNYYDKIPLVFKTEGGLADFVRRNKKVLYRISLGEMYMRGESVDDDMTLDHHLLRVMLHPETSRFLFEKSLFSYQDDEKISARDHEFACMMMKKCGVDGYEIGSRHAYATNPRYFYIEDITRVPYMKIKMCESSITQSTNIYEFDKWYPKIFSGVPSSNTYFELILNIDIHISQQ
jgi:hypothetical protein